MATQDFPEVSLFAMVIGVVWWAGLLSTAKQAPLESPPRTSPSSSCESPPNRVLLPPRLILCYRVGRSTYPPSPTIRVASGAFCKPAAPPDSCSALLSGVHTECPPTAPGVPRRNVGRPVRPAHTLKRACGSRQGIFDRNQRKDIRAEKIRARPRMATKLSRPRARGLPKRNL